MVTNLSRVYTQNNEVVTCDVVLNATDEPTFRTFYKTTLAMGTQWFNGDILRNGVYESYELCFIGAPPVFTPIAQNVVKASFTLLTRGLPLPAPVPPENEYDPIVLAREPWGYWPFRDASPATAFYDRTGNGRDLIYTGSGILYQQGALNTDSIADSAARTDSTSSWRLRVNANDVYDNDISVTVGGWVKFYNDSPVEIKSLFQIGGSGGSAQFYYLWVYRNAAGNVAMGWHHHIPPSGPNTFITKTFTTTLPLDTIFWFEAGIDHDNNRVFFRVNDGAFEYQSFDSSDEPNGLDHTAGRITYFHVGQRPVGTAGDPIDGQFSHIEAYDRVVTLGMWDDWHF